MTQEQINKGQKFARVCSVTGQPMWEGWVIGDGEEYGATEEVTEKLLRERGISSIQEAYDKDLCYWTDWGEDEEENAQYIRINGVLYDYYDGEVGEVVA